MGQTAVIQALNSLLCSPAQSFSSSSSLLSLRGSEGGHPLLQALNQPAGDLARPGYSARFLCLSACYAAISLQLVPGYTATGTEMPFQPDAFFSACTVPKFHWQTALFHVSVWH